MRLEKRSELDAAEKLTVKCCWISIHNPENEILLLAVGAFPQIHFRLRALFIAAAGNSANVHLRENAFLKM